MKSSNMIDNILEGVDFVHLLNTEKKLFEPEELIKIIKKSYLRGLFVWGFDGFLLKEKNGVYIAQQPCQEHELGYDEEDYGDDFISYDEFILLAIGFLEARKFIKNLFFEVDIVEFKSPPKKIPDYIITNEIIEHWRKELSGHCQIKKVK